MSSHAPSAPTRDDQALMDRLADAAIASLGIPPVNGIRPNDPLREVITGEDTSPAPKNLLRAAEGVVGHDIVGAELRGGGNHWVNRARVRAELRRWAVRSQPPSGHAMDQCVTIPAGSLCPGDRIVPQDDFGHGIVTDHRRIGNEGRVVTINLDDVCHGTGHQLVLSCDTGLPVLLSGDDPRRP